MEKLAEMESRVMSADELFDDRSVVQKARGEVLSMAMNFSSSILEIAEEAEGEIINQAVLEKVRDALDSLLKASKHYDAEEYWSMINALHATEESIWEMLKIAGRNGPS